MHLPVKMHRRRKSIKFTGSALRSRRNAVVELSDERERHLEQLFMAICSGDTDEMGQILRARTSSTFVDTSSDLLNCACATGNAASVRILLENGIPFRSVGGKGDAPLHTVVRRGSLDLARLLVDSGADLNVETKSERRSPLHLAAASRKLDLVGFLIEKGAEVDQVDIYGSTALHLAAEIGFSNGVGALLEAKADPDVFNRDGWTALHLAAANGHVSIVEQLVAAHATVDCQNRFGKTPLHWACVRGHDQIVRVLLRHNASIEVRDKNDRTAFDHASTREIRNLIDATSSVVNLSVIPRISQGIHYVVGESTLRLTRASAFVDALERARWSSNSDSGLTDCQADDREEARWSFNGEASQGAGGDSTWQRRHRKMPIWSKPEDWPPRTTSVVSATEIDQLQVLQKNGKQPSSRTGRSISDFACGLSPRELIDLWSQEDAVPQRSQSETLSYLDKAHQLGRLLSPIQEDDKSSVSTSRSLLGGDEDIYSGPRTRPSSSEPKVCLRPRRSKAFSVHADSSTEDDSTPRGSSKNWDSDSNEDSGSPTSDFSCRELTRDLEKILKRVSQVSERDEVPSPVLNSPSAATGVQSSHALIGALNTGLRQLLTHLDAAQDSSEDLFSEA